MNVKCYLFSKLDGVKYCTTVVKSHRGVFISVLIPQLLTITLKDSLLFLDIHRLKINVKINVIKVNFGLAQRFHHAHVNTNKSLIHGLKMYEEKR